MILVTGGTGLLGSHLLVALSAGEEEVRAVKRPSSRLEPVREVFAGYGKEAEERFGSIQWVDADLMNEADVMEVVRDTGRVYHCAARVSFQPRHRKEMIRGNVHITRHIVSACHEHGISKLLHVSSSSAIGNPPEGSEAGESMIWARTRTSTSYSVSKFKSEMEVWRGMEEGLDAVIVNPTVILGEGFWDRGSSAIFPRIDHGHRYYTGGVTGYVGVRDVVAAMTALMGSGITGERFILNSENLSYGEVLSLVAEALGKKTRFRPIAPRFLNAVAGLDAIGGWFTGNRHLTAEQARVAFQKKEFSSRKIRDALGIGFTPIKEVIRQIAQAYKNR